MRWYLVIMTMLALALPLGAADDADGDEIVAAVLEENPHRLRLLLDKGVALKSTNRSPLVIAFYKKNTILFDMLLSRKTGLDAYERITHDGMTPLCAALMEKRQDLALRLLDAGANPNLGMTGMGAWYGLQYPLNIALEARFADVVIRMLDKGADLNAVTVRGRRLALPLAIGTGEVTLVRLLLQRGAVYNRGYQAESPFLVAVAGGNRAIVDVLLEHERRGAASSWKGAAPKKEYLSAEWARYLSATAGDPSAGFEGFRKAQVVSLVLQRRAFAMYKQGKDREALPVYERALDYYATAGLYYNYGNSLSNIPRLADSIKAYRIALDLGHPEPHLVLYNMACACSRLKDAVNAFAYLEKAVAEGYAAFAYMRDDGDLAWLRTHARWASWFDGARKRARVFAASDVEAVFKSTYMGRWLVNAHSNVKMVFRKTANTPEFGIGEYEIMFIDEARGRREYPMQIGGWEGGAFRIAGANVILMNQFAYMQFPRSMMVKPLGPRGVEINGVAYTVGETAKPRE